MVSPRIKSITITAICSLANPESISVGVSMPATPRAIIPTVNVKPGPKIFRKSDTIINAMTIRTMSASVVILFRCICHPERSEGSLLWLLILSLVIGGVSSFHCVSFRMTNNVRRRFFTPLGFIQNNNYFKFS